MDIGFFNPDRKVNEVEAMGKVEGHDKIRESVSFFIAVWAFNGGARNGGRDMNPGRP